MDTTDFLRRVLPSEGHYVGLAINGETRRQQSYSTLDTISTALLRLDARNVNTYFAISSFVESGNRKASNVHLTKALFIDIDIGEETDASGDPLPEESRRKYPTRKDALRALQEFLTRSSMPSPLIVDSGRGYHVYWVLDEAVDPMMWAKLSNALKAATQALGFRADPSVTADIARVLRPVGTHNHKNGREVSLLLDAPDTTVERLEAALAPYMRAATSTAPAVRGFGKGMPSALTAALSTDTAYESPLAHALVDGCAQIGWAVENQPDVDEPFWYALMGIAAFCADSEAVAVAWSSGHPDYDEAKTLGKAAQWREQATGPTTCKRLRALRPAGCAKCPLLDRISTPAQIGRRYVEAEGPIADAIDEMAEVITLPKPYKRIAAGGIAVTIDETDIVVSPFDLYPLGYGPDEALGYEVVRYHWKRPHRGWQELKFRQAYLTDGHREFATALADQGIVLTNRKQTEVFQAMLRTYMDSLRTARTTTNLYTSLGWKDDNSVFVLGDTLVSKGSDGNAVIEGTTLSATVQRLGTALFTTKGTQENWTRATRVLQVAMLPAHMLTLGVCMSAPLYTFTGLKGAILSLYGQTGSGKTLAQLWGQSVWGSPEELHFGSKYTQNALFSRLAFYCNLPMTIDETTMMPDKEVGDFIYWVTQGKDKSRLSRTSEERVIRTWSTPVILSTNRPMSGKLLAASIETDAQQARLLEVEVPQTKVFQTGTEQGRKIFELITGNYGHTGRVILEELVAMGSDAIREAIALHMRTVAVKYKTHFTGEERYWEVMIVLQDYISMKAKEWGLIDYDYTLGTEYALSQTGMIRRAVTASRIDGFDILTEYLNETAQATVVIMHTEGAAPIPDHTRLPRGEVRARFDVYRKTPTTLFTHGTLMIDKVHLRKWMSLHGHDWKALVELLDYENINVTPASGKAMLAKNTPIRLGQSYVLGVNLAHDRLRDVLNNIEEPLQNMSSGHLRLVT